MAPVIKSSSDTHGARGVRVAHGAHGVAGWHRLQVASVRRVGDDAVSLTLDVPEPLADTFAHRPGQHVTIRHTLAGRELRRSYSVCPPPDDPGRLRLVVKRLGPGGFAEYATNGLTAGDVLEVAGPAGDFHLADAPGGHHVLIAGGSGITPLLSMAEAALRQDPTCRVSLLYANRTMGSVLLADDLATLERRYGDRFSVVHVLSREPAPTTPPVGRIDQERLPELLAMVGADRPAAHRYFYLCGPWGLVETARKALADWGADEADVRFELFSAGDREEEPSTAPGRSGRITVYFDGEATDLTMEPEDESVLDAVLRAQPDVPYSCRDGLCGVCRARVVSGEVVLARQYALTEKDLARGYTLPCRARPATPEIALDFDA